MNEILIRLENAMSEKSFKIIMSNEGRKNAVLKHLQRYKGENAMSHAINSFSWGTSPDYNHSVFISICDECLDLNVIEANKDQIEFLKQNGASAFHSLFN